MSAPERRETDHPPQAESSESAAKSEERSQTVTLSCGHEVLDANQVHYCDYIGLNLLWSGVYGATPFHNGEPRALLHHDEKQFVAVHQMSEQCFEMILFSLDEVISALDHGELDVAVRFIERMSSYIKATRGVMQPLLTMRPEDFAKFRWGLYPASGAESIQFRMIEIRSGLRADSPYAEMYGKTFGFREFLDRAPRAGDGPGYPKTRWWTAKMSEECERGRSLATVFAELLEREELELKEILSVERTRGDLWERWGCLINALRDYEAQFQSLRALHVKVAESQVGVHDQGTGHTSGVPYLRSVWQTARFFPELMRGRSPAQLP